MIEVVILCFVLVLLVTLYRTFAFENGMPTCKNYVANVFLYVAAVLVSVAIPTFIVKRNRYLKRYRRRFIERPLSLLIVVLLVYLLLVWSYAKLVEIPSSDFLGKTLSTLVIVLILAFVLSLFIELNEPISIKRLQVTSLLAIAIMIVPIFVGIMFGTTQTFERHVIAISLVYFLIELGIAIAFGINNVFILTGLTLILLLTAVSAGRVFENMKNCSKTTVDYPTESFDFVVNFISIFERIILLRGIK